MGFRKFQAERIFTGRELLDTDQVLITDEKGKVADIVSVNEAGEDIQVVSGWICPGFVNSHCHLELSHMKGLIPEHTGLVDFIIAIVTQRHFPEDEILQAISDAENEMIAGGIVAVGDISNNAISLNQKAKNRLAYYTFLEISGWSPMIADPRFLKGKEYYDLFEQLNSSNCQLSMAAHAPYSVSQKLWGLLQPFFQSKTTSLHNQETDFEDAYFLNKSGDFNRMYEFMQIPTEFFTATGKSSVQSVAHHLHGADKVLLVHDTFTKESDIDYLQNIAANQPNKWQYCLCVNANQYINNALPPIEMLREKNCRIVVGTDSLASNHSLSILNELKTIGKFYKTIPLTEQLQWASFNGAAALGFNEQYGEIVKGKQPGIILIDGIENNQLTTASAVRRLI
ncbi:MAG: amidohydrolase family protein [Sediminibacterium sp.]